MEGGGRGGGGAKLRNNQLVFTKDQSRRKELIRSIKIFSIENYQLL